MTHTDAAADLTAEELADMYDAAMVVVRQRGAGNAAFDAACVTCEAIEDETQRRLDVAQARVDDIASAHYATAVDQAYAYDTLEDAFDSYGQNAMDTAHETGVDVTAVSTAFDNLVAAHAAA